MIGRLLRVLGVHEERPDVPAVRFPVTESEMRYERVRRTAESTISRANRETDESWQRLTSWEDLYNDPRRQR